MFTLGETDLELWLENVSRETITDIILHEIIHIQYEVAFTLFNFKR